MLTAVLVSFAVVFLAELGDKSQLLAMTYALRHRWWVVLAGVGIAAALIHGLSVTIGYFLGASLPARPIAFAAAIAFLFFAVWTWREGRSGGEDDESGTAAAPRFVIPAVVSSYLLAELGDKTMLATVALASERPWAGVWVGATLAMIVADGLAIAVGALLGRRLPEALLRNLAALLFLLFGIYLLLDGGFGQPQWAIGVTAGIAAAAAVLAALLRWRRHRHARSPRPDDQQKLTDSSAGR